MPISTHLSHRPYRLFPVRSASVLLLAGALGSLGACGDIVGRSDGGGVVMPVPDLALVALPDLALPPASPDGGGQAGCGQVQGCYTVYAHSDHVLYRVDLQSKKLVEVGPFKAPMVSGKEDAMTDLGVAPDDTIFAASRTTLYRVDPRDGHVTQVAALGACGSSTVAMTFMPDGKLYVGDAEGAYCRVDLAGGTAKVVAVGTLGSSLGYAGDFVAVADGTIYATVFKTTDTTTKTNNLLARVDPATGKSLQVMGATGYPRLFGAAFSGGRVFGFTSDGSGDVVTIDPKTGKGTLFGTFTDPATGKGISFAGAGVNSMVDPTIG